MEKEFFELKDVHLTPFLCGCRIVKRMVGNVVLAEHIERVWPDNSICSDHGIRAHCFYLEK